MGKDKEPSGLTRIFRKMANAVRIKEKHGEGDPRHPMPILPKSESELDKLLQERIEPVKYRGVTQRFKDIFIRHKK